jgi:hypothetical protein
MSEAGNPERSETPTPDKNPRKPQENRINTAHHFQFRLEVR